MGDSSRYNKVTLYTVDIIVDIGYGSDEGDSRV